MNWAAGGKGCRLPSDSNAASSRDTSRASATAWRLTPRPLMRSTERWIRTASDNALAIDVAGGLVLNFDGSGGAHDWALKWSGDRLAALQALLDEAYVTVNQASYQVFYDEGENATFVAVPEPAPGALVVLAVAARAVFIRRHARR